MNSRTKLNHLLSEIEEIQAQGRGRGIARASETEVRPELKSLKVVPIPDPRSNLFSPTISETKEEELVQQVDSSFNPAVNPAASEAKVRVHLNEKVRFQLLLNEMETVVEVLPLESFVVLQFPDGKSFRIPRRK